MKPKRKDKIISIILLIILLSSVLASLLRAFIPHQQPALIPSASMIINLISTL